MTTNKEHFFETKEDYLKFKKQWASAVNDPKAKKELIREKTSWGTTHVYQKKGWLQAVHHIIYNIVRDKPLNHGFTPITNKDKIRSNSNNPDFKFDHAKYEFEYFQKSASNSRIYEYVMAPFADTISASKLMKWTEKVHR